jgi:copper homeostasis protein
MIEASGGDRIELVSALEIGGVTPSATIVRKSLEAASIPTHVIVRHHNNRFVHPKEEANLLVDEIINLRDQFQVRGVVVGGIQS